MQSKQKSTSRRNVVDPVEFSYSVERIVAMGEYELLSSAILAVADDYDIPDDKIKRYLTPNLLAKLQIEAEEEGVIQKESTATYSF